MAKRKKTKTSRRRRRVSGIGKVNAGSALTQIGGVLVGVAAGAYLNKLALSGKSNTIQAAVPAAAGIAVQMFLKSDLGKSIGSGLIAYGGGKFLSNMGLSGIGADSIDLPVSISGDDTLSMVAGDDDYAMAGDDDYAMAGDDTLTSLAGFYDDTE